jgi:hypothetical protein
MDRRREEDIELPFTKIAIAAGFVAAVGLPSFAQAADASFGPKGRFFDQYGTSFDFTLCGDARTDLCGVLVTLKGRSATVENLAFVGKQVMHAMPSGPNQWKGVLSTGSTQTEVTVTMAGPDTIEIQGCKAAILCETLPYSRLLASR